jgi:chromate transporter
VHDVFLGVGPAVLAIIAIAAYKLARATNKTDPVLWVIAGVLCAVTAITGAEIAWLFLVAGAFGAIYYGGGLPRRRGAGMTSVSPLGLLAVVKGLSWTGSGVSAGSLGWFFFKAGAFTFGSGLAIVPFLQHGLVEEHRWLTEQQFVDAVAMGLISPGPVVIMATFAGYLAYGLAGALIATACVFLPALLLVVLPGPLIRRHETHPRLQGLIKGATAAAAGAIAGAAIVIGGDIVDRPAAVVIGVVSLGLLLQRNARVSEPLLVAAAAIVGVVAYGL